MANLLTNELFRDSRADIRLPLKDRCPAEFVLEDN
jgi:hypothetical protein